MKQKHLIPSTSLHRMEPTLPLHLLQLHYQMLMNHLMSQSAFKEVNLQKVLLQDQR